MSDVKIVLIGHRGVGKTELLDRLRIYFPQFKYFDLDTVISKKLSNPIYKIFETFGEDYFRSKEIELAHELLSKKDVIVSLGAGFNLDALPEDVMCVWVRRITDSDGRIFLNRPALNPALIEKMSPIEDYLSRYSSRSKKYLESADFVYDMPEGVQILELKPLSKKGVLIQEKNLFKTILFRTQEKRKGILTLNKRNAGGKVIFETVELRTDVFPAKDIIRYIGVFRRRSKILLSFRKDNARDWDELSDIFSDVEWIDIDSQLSTVLNCMQSSLSRVLKKKVMISCHLDLFSENINRLESLTKPSSKTAKIGIDASFMKCSPLVKSFDELKQLYEWHLVDPKNRFIFPRSLEGDWQWFRCFMLSRQNLNFVNDGFSSVQDQPTLLDSFLYSDTFINFAAVIGNPIIHSYSPVFHYEFMKKRNSPYFRIKIEEKEFIHAVGCLEYLGLHRASVTSPFKESFYRMYKSRYGKEIKLKSVNTFALYGHGQVELTNTDTLGILKTLNELAADFFKRPLTELTIVLWGGGGVVTAVKSEIPHIHLVASRDGKLPKSVKEIDVLIWAAPRSLLTQYPKNCTIKSVFDLSYTGNSMGLELAKQHKIPYFSGLDMFKEQARGQQNFWSQFDERK